MENNEVLKMSFSFTDEFGQNTTVNRTVCLSEETTHLQVLYEGFIDFVKGCGFHQDSINEIILNNERI